VIILAGGLSAVSLDLGTGTYITDAVSSFVTPELTPLLIFVVSMLITVATGFSWSSMAIVMPIAFQMVAAGNNPELIPVVSAAVISGAVSGEHIIPFSEKAVMSAAACKITPVYHIKTQILQSVAVFLAACLGYLIIGYDHPVLLALIIPLALLLGVHLIFAKPNNKAVIR
jgi:Na+/H+ antiporter NhaC